MIISTIKERCRQCYACVRNCPVKAVKIERGQAEVIQSRCIECGNCLKVCSQEAKHVMDCREEVKKLLVRRVAVALILAPSYPVLYPQAPQKLIPALKSLGFSQVWTAAVGAQIMLPEYKKFIERDGISISSACPAVVNLIEKHFPGLLNYLVPVVSPMVTTALYVKSLYPNMKIVFAGPCTAKKGEVLKFNELIQFALSFRELNSLLTEAEVKIQVYKEEELDGPTPYNGQLVPLSGGLTRMLNVEDNLLETEYLTVDGQKECYQTLEAIAQGTLQVKFIDMLMCKGCIDGPSIDTNDVFHLRQRAVAAAYKSIPLSRRLKGKTDFARINNLSLQREFTNQHIPRATPSEEEIQKILAGTGKITLADQINCGACGYNSCREKAIAVYQGLAEVEMCLPYLLENKSTLLEKLKGEYLKVTELNSELDTILNSSYDGICITDGAGIILKANKAFDLLYGLDKNWVGTYAGELEEKKLATPSVTVLVLKEKRPVTMIQRIHNGRDLLSTGTPIYNQAGQLTNILINSRDFLELERLKHHFDRNLDERERFKLNIGTGNIIAYSQPMAKVLETCRKIAKVDSTVLVTGESGVGKEVIAGYIHSISHRHSGPWVKVNCGTIPENLIESELFGYESGAFTGANREGKTGMFELAHQGTILLDEIGELPYNLQVKLLQVLQEKCLIRLGGTKPIQVDIRIIAATNRNLGEMVKNGKFRQDLYYRLNVIPIHIPPLRERRDDIVPLVHHFLDYFNKKYGVSKKLAREVIQIFLSYDWPGNIRELVNLTERLVVTTESLYIEENALPAFLTATGGLADKKELPYLEEALNSVEKELLEEAYKKYANSYKMAEALGVNQSTIIRKLKKYGIGPRR